MTDPTLIVTIPGRRTRRYRLTEFLIQGRTLVTLGRRSDEIYNCVDIDSEHLDPFQCQFSRDDAGRWTIQHGQLRTECPRGLKSARQIACTSCPGCCINIRPGRPNYFWRHPAHDTLLNGHPLDSTPHLLHPNDSIEIADILISFEC